MQRSGAEVEPGQSDAQREGEDRDDKHFYKAFQEGTLQLQIAFVLNPAQN